MSEHGAGDPVAVHPPERVLVPALGRRPRRRPNRVRYLVEWVVIVAAALTVALFVRATVVQAFYIPSPSMVPTLEVGDRLLVDKLSYKLHSVRRGDIVVFRAPPNEPDRSIKDLIKRVIGLPGETIEAREGAVFINGRQLEERYLPEGTVTLNLPRQVVPTDTFWVMGDNRGNSGDSRLFGPISKSLIVGKALVRIFPPGRIGRF